MVLGLAGSPRRGGNTELLLDRALSGAASAGAQVEKVVLNRLKARPCQECGSCDTTGVCKMKDEMQSLYPKLEETDGIVLASPIFFMSLSAQAKTIIDRCQAFWSRKYLLGRHIGRPGQKRLGLFIATGGTNRGYTFKPSITVVKSFFSTIEVGYFGELLYGSVDARGDIFQHPSAMDDAFKAGVRLVEALLSEDTEPAVPLEATPARMPTSREAESATC